MNFDIKQFESGIYGNVDTDEDLLKELKGLGIEADDDDDCEAEFAALMREEGVGSDDEELLKQLSGPSKSKVIKNKPVQQEEEDLENDEEMMNELHTITGNPKKVVSSQPAANINIDKELLDRLKTAASFYQKQVEFSKQKKESAKEKRYQRQLDKLKQQIRDVLSGKDIDVSEIPPVPSGFINAQPVKDGAPVQPANDSVPVLPPRKAPNVPVAKGPSKAEKVAQFHGVLRERMQAFLTVAELAQSVGDQQKLAQFAESITQFKEALEAINETNIDDCSLEDIPPGPEPYNPKKAPLSKPKTLMEDLLQRKQFYIDYAETLKAKNDERRLKSNKRIIASYDEAITALAKKQTPDIGYLPCPPSFEPLTGKYDTIASNRSSASSMTSQSKQTREPAPTPPKQQLSREVETNEATQTRINPHALSKQEAQLFFLRRRYSRFKTQALSEKQSQEIDKAKECLRTAKGIEVMMKVSDNGLPVDLAKVPMPPQLDIPKSALKCIINNPEPYFNKLEKALMKQLSLCLHNLIQVTSQNDANSAILYEDLAEDTLEDIIILRQQSRKNKLPKFHYVEKVLPRAQVNSDLDDTILEFNIISANDIKPITGYKNEELCPFVKYEFPFPHNDHPKGSTPVINYTNSPEFNEKIIFKISRQSTQFIRIIGNKKLRLELFHKGGFLRSDKPLGHVDVPLKDLENYATLAMRVPIMDGRKKTEGTVDVTFRLSKSIGPPKMDTTKEQWLELVK
uniref:C2 domain-containing protein n=1 Tax=Rhabditophanes sp. KR3021 TaxID=114890 RepID=A0AC35TU32_9BILA